MKNFGKANALYADVSVDFNLYSELGVSIYIDIENLSQFVSNFKHAEFWCKPVFGSCLKDVPNNTQGLIAKKEDGSYLAILPVVSEKYKCVLEGNEENLLEARLFSWYENLNECKCLALTFAEGDNPFELISECAKLASKLLGGRCKLRNEREYPEIFEYLGWCSWDAFGIEVNEKGIEEKCEEFKAKQIPVKWAIVDDMWAEVRNFWDKTYETREEMFNLMHSSSLSSFKADSRRFPSGLKSLIEKVNGYGIKVGVWHPTTGYWKGIDKESDIYKEHKDLLLQVNDEMLIPSYEYEKAYGFYKLFHDYLESCGTEFVKIDNQSMTRRFYKKYAPVGEVARQFHDAMERSVKEHFGGVMINCMGMANEDMWNRTDSAVARCSDDFQPEDRPWFTKHILQCTYNCLIQGRFYYCDYDMWWTDDGQAIKNSLLRAVSGGPVYVSDKLSRSRAEVIKPLVFENGRILRCDKPGIPTADCLTENPTKNGKSFKVQNTANGCGVLAVFNLDSDNKAVYGSISSSNIKGLCGDEFGVYEHFSKSFITLKKGEKHKFSLADNDEFKLFIFVPLKNGNGTIGRIDKFISPLTYRIKADETVELIEAGPFAVIENRKLIIKE
ncbi:MAG: alpha-galactosidase [Clostridia bacterium]|nr:alpha-galactosidase [Clostridia bacterium]